MFLFFKEGEWRKKFKMFFHWESARVCVPFFRSSFRLFFVSFSLSNPEKGN